MPLLHLSRPAMGSIFEIFAFGDDEESLNCRLAETLDFVELLESQLSVYLPDSEISLINAAACRQPVQTAANLFSLLLRLREWSEKTEGAFDPTAGKLIREWGFYRRGHSHGKLTEAPPQQRIEAIATGIGWGNIELNERDRSIRFLSPEIELNLGAVGKGYVVQCAAERLRELGVSAALLHSGHSSIVAMDAPEDSNGWKVGFSSRSGEQQKTTLLKNRSLSISDSGEQTTSIGGETFGHLLYPRTGFPVKRDLTIAVEANDAAEADALSTAFLINGREWTENFCENNPGIEAHFFESRRESASL